MARTSAAEIPVVRLSCPSKPAGLCRAAMGVIIEISSGRFDVRRVEPADATPSREGDLGLALTLDGQGESWIAAHFDWQVGPNGSRGRGPSVEMSVMDTTLSPDMYGRFAESLIKQDQGLRALLSCSSD